MVEEWTFIYISSHTAWSSLWVHLSRFSEDLSRRQVEMSSEKSV